MFMKHTISRFFRFFLVAALVAAMAGSLLPSKALGQEATPTTTVSLSTTTTGASPEWTIGFTATESLVVADNDTIEVDFSDAATVPDVGDVDAEALAAAITVQSGDGEATDVVTVTRSGDSITITTPVAIGAGAVSDDPSTEDVVEENFDLGGTGTIVIGAEAGITLDAAINVVETPAAGASVEVTTTGGTAASSARFAITTGVSVVRSATNAGSVAQWQIGFTPVVGLSANASLITLKFSHASVPADVASSDISVLATADVDGTDTTVGKLLEVAPTRTSSSITFFTPVSSDGDNLVTIVVATTAGVANGLRPTDAATVKVQAGTNAEGTSAAFTVGQYLSFSPSSGAARGATVAVSGGGFSSGTSGSIRIGVDRTSTGGSYTVDSSGKLSGSFVASNDTKGGGTISVQDLGSGKWIETAKKYEQKPSATPATTDVPLGGSVNVKVSDFPDGDISANFPGADSAVLKETLTSGTYKLPIPQDSGTGTKLVTITSSGGGKATFLIEIVTRVLTVNPSSAVPGQAVAVSGSGFTGVSSVDLTLTGQVDDEGNPTTVLGGAEITVNTDGTFLYTGKVPFNSATATHRGLKQWKATKTLAEDATDEEKDAALAATSAGFSIQARTITLSPSTANPGSTVEVFGSGWGVTARGNVTSEVLITLSAAGSGSFGPFPVSSSGEFQGAFTVPANSDATPITVTATDNNGTGEAGDGLTNGFAPQTNGSVNGNQTASKMLRVPTGVVVVSPDTASTGAVITVTGTGFPAQTNLSALKFGAANALPVPAPATDVTGRFTVTITVPAAQIGGSLKPGAVVIRAMVGQISGTTSFTIPGPEVSLSSGTARPGESLTITGTGFSAFANVDAINFGAAPALPVPNPRTDAVGDFSASVIVPTLNPGAYTITVRTGAGFAATTPVTILSGATDRARTPEEALRSLTAKGLLTLAAAAPPGGTEFGAYVPDLAGNTLALIQPNGVLVLTLNADARVSVSGQPAVDVAADTPTFFAIGATVSVEVIE